MPFLAVNNDPASGTGIVPTTLLCEIFPKIRGGGNRHNMLNGRNIIRHCREAVTKKKATAYAERSGQRSQ